MALIRVPGFGPYTLDVAAQIVSPDGEVLAQVREPQPRADTRRGMALPWDEAAW